MGTQHLQMVMHAQLMCLGLFAFFVSPALSELGGIPLEIDLAESTLKEWIAPTEVVTTELAANNVKFAKATGGSPGSGPANKLTTWNEIGLGATIKRHFGIRNGAFTGRDHNHHDTYVTKLQGAKGGAKKAFKASDSK